ncbi:helix-turn-helix transcriptional regulator [Chitinophaga agrisoli]|uniref:Helix-turn-helix transcriptional regulator n=1 Tax=Chitinophaga agrisoli TaxID=2607653 RepID=A0A5B2VPQ3_9BACT|nr:response regulator transcription factor [Chitinophaga agrisoli]KAA2240272.1 helix-turn-helix transcriptional regulator [Chitinophaga agrisoli]
MEHFKNLADIHRFNGIPMPENPLFSVYRCTQTCGLGDREFTSDFYMIGFKKLKAGVILYGRTKYDHNNGSLIFIKPRQVIEFKSVEYDEDAFLIFIHEDFLNGHFLHSAISKYAFFDYETNEALHLSPAEEQTIWDLYYKIETEYRNNTDEYSRDIMLTHIDSILKYSQRFYKRQFINRMELSGKTVSKFHEALDAYFKDGVLAAKGLPTVNALAAQLNLSPRYLSDLLKQETGKTAIELIHIYLVNEAKNRLKTDDQRVSDIAYELGFENLPYFSRLFKKETGISPNQFKKGLMN